MICDIHMEPWDGLKLAEKIYDLTKKQIIPDNFNLIFISGDKKSEVKIPNYPFVKEFYQKPIHKNVLIEIIEKYYKPFFNNQEAEQHQEEQNQEDPK